MLRQGRARAYDDRNRFIDDRRGLEFTVGASHGVGRHAQLPGQVAHRGQAATGRKRTGPDSVDNLRSELVEQRLARFRVDP